MNPDTHYFTFGALCAGVFLANSFAAGVLAAMIFDLRSSKLARSLLRIDRRRMPRA